MLDFLIAAGLAAAASAGPREAPTSHSQLVIVEGRRAARQWTLPDLDYSEPSDCPALVATELPGFGEVRVRRRCPSDPPADWRLFQY